MMEWKLTGGLQYIERPGSPPGNSLFTFCEGPSFGVNETVVVIDKEEYNLAIVMIDYLKMTLLDLKHLNNHLIEEEVWRIDRALDLLAEWNSGK